MAFNSTWYNTLRNGNNNAILPSQTILGSMVGLPANTNLSQYSQNLLAGNYTGTGMGNSRIQVANGAPAPTGPSYPAMRYQYPQLQQGGQGAAPLSPLQQALAGVNMRIPGMQQAVGESSKYLQQIQAGLGDPGTDAYNRSLRSLAGLPDYLNQQVAYGNQAKKTAEQTRAWSLDPAGAQKAGVIGGNLAATYKAIQGSYAPGASTQQNKAQGKQAANIQAAWNQIGPTIGLSGNAMQQFLNDNDYNQIADDPQRVYQDLVKNKGRELSSWMKSKGYSDEQIQNSMNGLGV